MSQFLAVITKMVTDQNFERAVPAIPAVMDADGDIELEPAVPEVPEVPLVEHEEVDRVYIEDAPAQVAKHLADPAVNPNLNYYAIKFNARLKPVLKNVRERGRVAAPVKEIVTIEDQDGNELGTAEV